MVKLYIHCASAPSLHRQSTDSLISCENKMHVNSAACGTTGVDKPGTRPPRHVDHAPVLTRSCWEVITPQLHRHTGAVESFHNYPQTEYGAPTSSTRIGRPTAKSSHCELLQFCTVDRLFFNRSESYYTFCTVYMYRKSTIWHLFHYC